MKSEPIGPPMTLGAAAAAGVWLIVWCKACHQVEPDPAEMAVQYGAETPMLDWRERLVCSHLRRSPIAPGRSLQGHEGRFPRRRLNARCGSRKRSFAFDDWAM
jgi:hypothetical protein